jgi:hypothetical protein
MKNEKVMFVEENCSIELDGKIFTSRGSYLCHCNDGRVRGAVYVTVDGWNSFVSTWHGEKLANCSITYYRGNFCKMARVSFSLNGLKFIGDYCPDWSELVKVRSTKAL